MIHYLIQLLVFQALFLGVYELFLKKETFFSLNRIYLLITPFLAAIIPLIEFEILQNMVPPERMMQLPALVVWESGSSNHVSTTIELTTWEYTVNFMEANWLLIIYFLGTLVSFVLFLQKYVQLQNLKKSGNKEKREKITMVHIPNSRMACTFFGTIFLGENLSEKETIQILAHEQVHVEQQHSLDLLLFEFWRIFLWFDPFIYRCQSQLTLLHEYIADEKVTRKIEKKTYFQDLLNAAFATRKVSFTNQFFNHSLTKKRIMMLQKPKSTRTAKLKYLLVLPLLLLMLTYVACSNEKMNKETQEMVPPPPPPGPPTPPAVYQDYLKMKAYMKSQEMPFEMTFTQYKTMIKKVKKQEQPIDGNKVPFATVDHVPIFPGCENVEGAKAQKNCMSKKIRKFVNANFDIGLAKKLGLTGNNRISVRFTVNKKGKVVDIDVTASHPELKQEAIRVISSLPKMIPGKQEGKPVSVLYSLPIIFKAN